MKKIIILLTTFFLLSGCTIPRAVFKSSLINQDDPHYHLVEVTPTLKLSDADTVPKTIVDPVFAENNWHWTSLAKGDVLHITILSSGGAGYLSNNVSGDRADFENILVTDGNIVQVPYAGIIPVTGLDVTQLAEEIRKRLSRPESSGAGDAYRPHRSHGDGRGQRENGSLPSRTEYESS